MLGIDGRLATYDLSRGSPQNASIVERKYSSLRVAAPGTVAAGTSHSSGNSERAAFATLLTDARVTGGDTAVVAVASKTGFLELVAAGSLPLLPVASTSTAAGASAVAGLFPQAQSKSSSSSSGRSGANASSSAGTPLALTLASVHLRRLIDRAPGASGPAGLASANAAYGGGASSGSASSGSASSSSAHAGTTTSSADLKIAAISAGGGGGVLVLATTAGLVVLRAGWGATSGGHTGSSSSFAMHPAWSFPAFGGPYRPFGEAYGSSSSSSEDEEEGDGGESEEDELNDGRFVRAVHSKVRPIDSKSRKSRRLPTIASAARRGLRVVAGTQELWLCELYPGLLPQDTQIQQEGTAVVNSGHSSSSRNSGALVGSGSSGAWLRDIAPILLDVPLLGAPPWFTQAPPACYAPMPLPAAPFSPPDSGRLLSVAPAILTSPDGSLVALHWPFTHIYQVYRVVYNPASSNSSGNNDKSRSSEGGSSPSPWLGTEVLRGRAISLAWVTAPSPKVAAKRAAVDAAAASSTAPARGRRNSVKSGTAATAAAAAAAAATATDTTTLPPAVVYLAALEEEPLPDAGLSSGSSSGGSGGARTLGRRRASSADGHAAAGMNSGAAGAKTVLRVFTITLERQPSPATVHQQGVEDDDDQMEQRRRSSFEGLNSSSYSYSAVLRGYAPPYEALCCDAPTAPGWPSSASAAAGLLGNGPLLCVNFSASGGCPDPLHQAAASTSSSSHSSGGVLPMAAPSSAAFFSLDPVTFSTAAPSSSTAPTSSGAPANTHARTPVLLRPVGSAVDGALPPAVALTWAPRLPPPLHRRDTNGSGSSGTDCAESSADENDDDDDEDEQPRVAFLCAAGAFVLEVVAGPPPRRAPSLQLVGSTQSLRASPTSVAMAAASAPPSLLWAGENMLFASCPNHNNGNNSTEVWTLRLHDDDDNDDDGGDATTSISSPHQTMSAGFQAVLVASSAPSAASAAAALAVNTTQAAPLAMLPEGMFECCGLVAGSLVLAPRSGLPSVPVVPKMALKEGRKPPDHFVGWKPLDPGSQDATGAGMAGLCALRL